MAFELTTPRPHPANPFFVFSFSLAPTRNGTVLKPLILLPGLYDTTPTFCADQASTDTPDTSMHTTLLGCCVPRKSISGTETHAAWAMAQSRISPLATREARRPTGPAALSSGRSRLRWHVSRRRHDVPAEHLLQHAHRRGTAERQHARHGSVERDPQPVHVAR